MNKITIIGAGNVGAFCAQRLAERDYADIALLDIIEGLPQGKALDILQSGPVGHFNARVTGTNSYEETAGSDIVIVTSGSARKPGMTRDDLLKINTSIVSEVIGGIARYSPGAIIIMVTNPVEAMTHLALQISHFPRSRVLGLSGVLDGARLASFIAAELKVPVESVYPCVLGQHGESMVILPRLTTVNGRPLSEVMPAGAVKRLTERTIGGGAEIVRLLKTGSAFYAPSAAVARMVDAILLDKKETLHCSACLDGEYGISDTVLTVPVRLGRGGVEQIVELELTTEELAQLLSSAKAVQELISSMRRLSG